MILSAPSIFSAIPKTSFGDGRIILSSCLHLLLCVYPFYVVQCGVKPSYNQNNLEKKQFLMLSCLFPNRILIIYKKAATTSSEYSLEKIFLSLK
jgi:hypothetical protein